MQEYSCAVCCSRNYSAFSEYKGVAKEFLHKSIVKCEECGFLSAYPLPEETELNNYYNAYWRAQNENPLKLMLFQRLQADARFSFLQPYIGKSNPINIIDVGSGFGLIKNVFEGHLPGRTINYDCVEIDSDALDYLNRKIKARKIYSDIKESPGLYDVMIFSHILEHFPKPQEFLKEQKKRIAENGIIFIESPNKDFLYKTRNEPHLMFFGPWSLVKLVENSGFKILKLDTCGEMIERLKKRTEANNRKDTGKNKGSFIDKAVRKIKGALIFLEAMRSVSEYSGERRWIRLVAANVTQ